MSPPEVWGPAVWTLFHTLAEKLNSNAYNQVIPSMFNMIVQICKVLPCPECSRDASNFLAKIRLSDYKTKDEFKNMLYLFHNFVNAKKRKPLYNYAYMNKYANMNLIFVVNDFIAKYNTKGNMKLLAESFQRSFVIKNFIAWFNGFKLAFVQPIFVTSSEQIKEGSISDISPNILPTIEENSSQDSSVQKSSIEETIIDKQEINETNEEDLFSTDKTINSESVIDEIKTMDENNISSEESLKIQQFTEDSFNEFSKPEIEVKQEPVKSKKGRKSKSKK